MLSVPSLLPPAPTEAGQLTSFYKGKTSMAPRAMAPDERLHHWQSGTQSGRRGRHRFPCGAELRSAPQLMKRSLSQQVEEGLKKCPQAPFSYPVKNAICCRVGVGTLLRSPHVEERCSLEGIASGRRNKIPAFASPGSSFGSGLN